MFGAVCLCKDGKHSLYVWCPKCIGMRGQQLLGIRQQLGKSMLLLAGTCAASRHQWQCIVEFVAVNGMRAVRCNTDWSPALEVEVYGGNCNPDATIGVHSIIQPDPASVPVHTSTRGHRHIHVQQPKSEHVPALVRQSAQCVKAAMRLIKQGAGAMPMELDVPVPVASTSGHGLQDAAGSAMHAQRYIWPLEAGARGYQQPLEAGARGTQQPVAEAYSGSSCSSCALMGPESASPADLDVPAHYHEQASFNAAWHELMEEQLNEPAIQEGLGGPTPRQDINAADPYSESEAFLKQKLQFMALCMHLKKYRPGPRNIRAWWRCIATD
uniref:Uncharacterized protein n=1 Tax=Chlamydomonas chlamydogama TaxID=225041 RepID=A0A7S2QSJ1_9CHLO|mmetsp:Transcript_1178/g.2542  ORF Transcript_1178/g.2542 Transcript_1178/m.2542 type:complete len:326 (+) Transcript_1178:380-1357(+)